MRIKILLLVCALGYSVALEASSINVRTYIPKNAPTYLPILVEEVDRYFPEVPKPHYFGGLIEQESCISLTHSRCWSAKAELKTSREQGVGLGQITRTFNEDGSTRYDSLKALRSAYLQELRDLSWENVHSRPDLQIRAIVLMSRDNYQRLGMIEDPIERLKMADASYNAGLRNITNERRACGLAKGCNPNVWYRNVENHCLRSKRPLYGGKSACDITREHVYNVFELRMHKYAPFFSTEQKSQ